MLAETAIARQQMKTLKAVKKAHKELKRLCARFRHSVAAHSPGDPEMKSQLETARGPAIEWGEEVDLVKGMASAKKLLA